MPYPAKAVANYFLDLAQRDSKPLNPMKIQKLIYLAHGWNLATSDKALIKEHFKAWRYGPVVPTLYNEFKKYGASAITEPAGGTYEPDISDYADESSAVDAAGSMAAIWRTYADFSGIKLSALTHEEGSPWHRVITEPPDVPNKTIPNEYIREYFVNLVAEYGDVGP